MLVIFSCVNVGGFLLLINQEFIVKILGLILISILTSCTNVRKENM